VNILEQIVAVKKDEIRKLRADYRLRNFYDSPHFDRTAERFQKGVTSTKELSVIAEIKKASPSAGVICSAFDPAAIARGYEDNGAAAISVLTDRQFFQGHIEFLQTIADFSRVPLLRKDFILDEYQVFESRWAGADAILLIAEILSASQIVELSDAAREAGLDVLLELHNADQLRKIDLSRNRIIGINNRNLETFSVDLNTCISIKQTLPSWVAVVAESGIKGPEEIRAIKKARIDGILVGEHLMRAENPGLALKELRRHCTDES
jgi:indole-3-glycerol phosphate synthase